MTSSRAPPANAHPDSSCGNVKRVNIERVTSRPEDNFVLLFLPSVRHDFVFQDGPRGPDKPTELPFRPWNPELLPGYVWVVVSAARSGGRVAAGSSVGLLWLLLRLRQRCACLGL